MGSKGGGGDQVTGFQYYLTILVGISRGPLDQLFQVVCGGSPAWDGPVDRTTLGVSINRPNLFGGEQAEGGIAGYFNLYMGDRDQGVPADFAALKASGTTPGMRGVATFMYDGLICSNNPYPKEFKFRVRRVLKGWDNDDPWYPEKAVIMLSDSTLPTYVQTTYNDGRDAKQTFIAADGSTSTVTDTDGVETVTSYSRETGNITDTLIPQQYNSIYAMNGAHIVYEVCTNRDWGRGMDRALIDEVSFVSAANTLYAEQFGLCLKWSRQDDVDTFVQSVIDHIGGVLYTDKTTGLLCLRLIRADYDPAALSVFDYQHGLLSIESVDTATPDSVPNEVQVIYNSPVRNQDCSVRAQNIASVSALGSIFSLTKNYPGIPISDLAQRVAQRDLQAVSSGMKRVVVKVDRRGYLIVPGDVLIINVPTRGLPNVIVRVVQVEDTSLVNGAITLTTVQDVFGLPLAPFVAQEGGEWLEPNRFPMPITAALIETCSYRDVIRYNGEPKDDTQHGMGMMLFQAAKPTSLSMGYELWETHWSPFGQGSMSPWLETHWQRVHSFVPFIKCGRLEQPIGSSDTIIKVTGFAPADIVVGTSLSIYNTTSGWAYTGLTINYELVIVKSASYDAATGLMTITVGRGCVDTVGWPHPVGSRIWNRDSSSPQAALDAPWNVVANVKLLDVTLRGTYPFNQASNLIGLTSYYFERNGLPYSGSNFRLAGQIREQTGAQHTPLAFTWNHRDRIAQGDQLLEETAASVGPETGIKYTVRIYERNPRSTWGEAIDVNTGCYGWSDIVSDHFTATSAMMTTATMKSGPKTAVLYTDRDPYGSSNITQYMTRRAMQAPTIDFYYLAGDDEVVPLPPDPLTSGWGVDFGRNFGAPA